jgi:hypothetical protein
MYGVTFVLWERAKRIEGSMDWNAPLLSPKIPPLGRPAPSVGMTFRLGSRRAVEPVPVPVPVPVPDGLTGGKNRTCFNARVGDGNGSVA